jgi:autotransporter-associated beta strand protein
VANGTLVLDNNGALINNTSDTGGINKLDQSSFILGTTTNVFYYVTTKQNYSYSPPSEVLVAEDNNYNATVYLGDPESGGGLSVDAKVVNYVSDGDVGFTNSGIFTIGGQNTGGINTYNNAIILGLTPNRGKSVTLVSATGGEVDFNGNILANGSDKTAGVTVGDIAHAGIVKFTAANTYGGNTFINNGTLALSGRGSIAKSQNIVLAAGATLNVSTLTSAFSLGFGQMLGNSASTACINGNVNTASGVVSLIYGTGTPSLTISNGTLNVANSTMFKIDNVGSALSPGSYKIISKQIGGSVTAATGLPAVTVGGGGMVLNTKATLQIIGGELYLIVSMR